MGQRFKDEEMIEMKKAGSSAYKPVALLTNRLVLFH